MGEYQPRGRRQGRPDEQRLCVQQTDERSNIEGGLRHSNIWRPSSSARQAPFKANRLAIIQQSSMFVLQSKNCADSDLTYETK